MSPKPRIAAPARHPRESANDEGPSVAPSIFHCVLPTGWKRAPIATNYRVTKKARGFLLDPDFPLPFIPMECVPAGGQTTCGFELRKPPAMASGTYFEAGDVLLSKITPSFENGKQGLARGLPCEFGYGSTEIIPLQSYTDDAINLYLFYLLLHHEIRDSLVSKMEGSTGRKRVPEGAVLELEVPVPPKPEQEKIAAVLWKLQRAIATQDQLLKATADLKASAMQRLFTHGLRGEPLKDTEIGPMPESWDIEEVRAIAKIKGGKRLPKGVPLSSTRTPFPYIRVTDFSENSVDTSNIRYVPPEVQPQISRYIITKNDVYISIAGSIGLVGMVPYQLDGANLTENAARLLPGERIDPAFLMRFLSSVTGQRQISSFTSKNAQPKLALTRIDDIRVPVPKRMDEQRAIAAALATLDRKLAHHRAKRAALHDLFQTLLHQLMTAQVRVADLDIDVSEVTDHLDDADKMVGKPATATGAQLPTSKSVERTGKR